MPRAVKGRSAYVPGCRPPLPRRPVVPHAARSGSPVLLVHGFPETWWTFHKLIPLLAQTHRVFAADLRGFGDSGNGPGEYDSKTSAEDLHLLIEQLDVGPVHLTGQDISGATVFRLAATHPQDVLSFTAIEMGLPGFGLEISAFSPRPASPRCSWPAASASSWDSSHSQP
jgi:pimeloyl-ACP methyl ester carboxylesterase